MSSPSKGGKGKGSTTDCAPSVPPTSEPTSVGKLPSFFVKLISSTSSSSSKEILILLTVVLRLLKKAKVREVKDLPRNALKLLPQLQLLPLHQLHAKIQLKDSPLTE